MRIEKSTESTAFEYFKPTKKNLINYNENTKMLNRVQNELRVYVN